mgnify:CR=1 FL=1
MTRPRKVFATFIAAVLSAIFLSAVSGATPAHASVYCDPSEKRAYSYKGVVWLLWDSGTINNPSSAKVTKKFIHTVSGTFSTTVSGEVSVSAKIAVVDINGKFRVSTSVSASITSSSEFWIEVPPHTRVQYKDGLVYRKYTLTVTTVSNSCVKSVRTATVQAVDNLTDVKDI